MNVSNNPPMQGLIKFLTGPLAGRSFPIRKAITTIGRDFTNDIVVEQDQRVSRYHARLLWNNGEWSIENVSQKAQLTVNQYNTWQAPLQDNSIVGLGTDTSFIFLTQAGLPVQQGVAADIASEIQSQPTPAPGQGFSTPGQVFPAPRQEFSTPGQVFPAPRQEFSTPGQVFPASKPPISSGTTPLISNSVNRLSPDQTQIASPSLPNSPSLVLSSNAYDDKKTHILDKPIINIGRDATNEIIINDRIVSGLHLRIIRQDNQFVLIHPNPDNQKQATLNGLLYQGRKIRGDEQFSKTLANGDIFRIGNEFGTLITLTYNDGTGAQQDMLPPMQPIKLGSSEITIGRAPDNTVVLSDPQVSAHHARIYTRRRNLSHY